MAPTNKGYYQVDSEDGLPLANAEQIEQRAGKSRWPQMTTICLATTTLIFGLYSLYLSIIPRNVCIARQDLQGYQTEWKPARENIEMKEVTFTSAFTYNETSKTYYREHNPFEPQYVGTPEPEIDLAWEDILAGQYLVVTEQEARKLENPVPIQGYYIAEVEVMHSLHCLNAIRKALNPEYYSVHDHHGLPEEINRVHVEHCIDQLRQIIQCAGDLTPVPLRPYGEAPDINFVGTPQVHTCRNWASFRSWYTRRGETYGRVDVGGT